eukprot:5129511-Amphidinium_carterae.1
MEERAVHVLHRGQNNMGGASKHIGRIDSTIQAQNYFPLVTDLSSSTAGQHLAMGANNLFRGDAMGNAT